MTINKNRRVDFNNRLKQQQALVSKLVPDLMTPKQYDSSGNRTAATPPQNILSNISQRTAGVTKDLESLNQLLPDIALSAQIMVSSILSPKDMGAPNLSYYVDSNFQNSELGSKLIKVISNYFTNDYKINDYLSEELHDILFEKGASIKMIIPESSLDEIINADGRITLESLTPMVSPRSLSLRPIGLLGDPVSDKKTKEAESQMSLESMFDTSPSVTSEKYSAIHKYISVVDNPDAVKMPRILNRIRSDVTRQRLSSSHFTLEKRKADIDEKTGNQKNVELGKNDREIEDRLRKKRVSQQKTVIEIKTRDQSDRESIGHGMEMNLPSEAVIPAYIPSNPSEHIGYFILLDQYGNPVNPSGITDHYRQLQSSFTKEGGANQNTINTLLTEIRGNMDDSGSGEATADIAQATNAFADAIERDLLRRLRKGLGHESVEIGRPNDVYQIMFSRTLKNLHTQILYVPVELVSYMAFYYTKQGVGKSLLEETRILGSLRVMMMFANTMAAIRNSTTTTTLGIRLDPEDTEPMGTVDLVRDTYMRSRSERYPLGEGDPASIISYLQNAGVSVVWEGHPGLPEMKVDIDERSGNKSTIDRDLEENLRRQHIMALGLSPETVDVSSNVEFATSIVNSSLLLSKRVALYQKKFETQKADHIRKYTYNSQILTDKLIKIVEDEGSTDDKKDVVKTVEKFIDAICVELPKPDTVTLETQMDAFNNYSDALERAIEAWISDEMAVMDAEGDMGNYLRELRAAVKAHFQRQWLRENHVFPELEALLEKDDKDKLIFKFGEIHATHMEEILSFVEDYLARAREAAAKRAVREEEAERKRQKEEEDRQAELERKRQEEEDAKNPPEEEEVTDDDESEDDVSDDDGSDDDSIKASTDDESSLDDADLEGLADLDDEK